MTPESPNVISGGKYRDGKLLWRSSGSSYYYEVKPVRLESDKDITLTVAYNGQYAQIFEPSEAVLSLAKEDFKTQPGPLTDDIFSAFSFFPSMVTGTPAFTNPVWKNIRKTETWDNIFNLAKYLGKSEVQGTQCDVIKMPAPDWFGKDTSFRVYLTTKPEAYPVKWELQNGEGKTVMRFTVQQFGESPLPGGLSFFYPAVAIKENFGPLTDGGTISEKPVSTVTYTISNLKVNPDLDEELFTIDAGMAEAIFDVDAKELITVPK